MRMSVRDGWRSPIPASAARARSSHGSGTHARWVITLVRRSGCAPSRPVVARRSASADSTSASLTPSLLQVPTSTAISVAAPGAPVAVDQVVRARRPPGSRGVVREGGPVARPGGDYRVDEQPLLLDLVRAGEERRVADHAVEDQ